MAITKEQKAALQAAGYTVSGNTVKSKTGGSVGGINANGNIWSGSGKVRGILESSAAPAKAAAKPRASKPTAKPASKAAPVAKDAMKGYRAGDVTTSKIPKSGRGDGAAEKIRRLADRAIDKADKTKTATTTPSAKATGKPRVIATSSSTTRPEVNSGPIAFARKVREGAANLFTRKPAVSTGPKDARGRAKK